MLILLIIFSYILITVIFLLIYFYYRNYFTTLQNNFYSAEIKILYEDWPLYKKILYDKLPTSSYFGYQDDNIKLGIVFWILTIPFYLLKLIFLDLPKKYIKKHQNNVIEKEHKLINLYKELNKDGNLFTIKEIKQDIKKEI